ncbi:hypothetical protein [Laspinema olomoucense]|uniref:hypothetical protein n=1 Tax=Laspinema olomoucense TaxID=3231600 RepID=UPI0021BB8BA2|nr:MULTISPECIES: hypothetical protein [unclassified Laspinema]MCT7975830.1 hypothetical protein [Laspinema sp. D3d]MCT7996569.1 hypothetical protein [Laspinema sp. D3c]
MTPISQLNQLEKKLRSFGITPIPRQDRHGKITLPVLYRADHFSAKLSAIGGKPTEHWRGQCSNHVARRIREHFQAFLAVDAF